MPIWNSFEISSYHYPKLMFMDSKIFNNESVQGRTPAKSPQYASRMPRFLGDKMHTHTHICNTLFPHNT